MNYIFLQRKLKNMDIFGGSAHAGNARYQLAKGQVDQLFLKWISQSTTASLINKLLTEIESA